MTWAYLSSALLAFNVPMLRASTLPSMEVAQMPAHELLPAVHSKVTNRVLWSLTEQEFQSIPRHLAFVVLRLGQVLYDGKIVGSRYLVLKQVTRHIE